MTHCPTCGQRIITQSRRLCADCGKPIARHDKYFFGADSRIRHRVCEQPTSYTKGPAETLPMIEALEAPQTSIEVSQAPAGGNLQ